MVTLPSPMKFNYRFITPADLGWVHVQGRTYMRLDGKRFTFPPKVPMMFIQYKEPEKQNALHQEK